MTRRTLFISLALLLTTACGTQVGGGRTPTRLSAIESQVGGGRTPTPSSAIESPVILNFTASSGEADPGEKVLLTWASENGVRAMIDVSKDTLGHLTYDQLPPSGWLAATIPNRVAPVIISLTVFGKADERATMDLAVGIHCTYTYFFTQTVPPEFHCPDNAPIPIRLVEQRFQRGRMIRSLYATGAITILFDNDSQLAELSSWQIGEPEDDPSLVPPSGLYQPVRDFGELWRDIRDPWQGQLIREELGWALAPEQEYDTVRQDSSSHDTDHYYGTATFLRTVDGRILGLYNTYEWGWLSP
jgi:hypothetical protein